MANRRRALNEFDGLSYNSDGSKEFYETLGHKVGGVNQWSQVSSRQLDTQQEPDEEEAKQAGAELEEAAK